MKGAEINKLNQRKFQKGDELENYLTTIGKSFDRLRRVGTEKPELMAINILPLMNGNFGLMLNNHTAYINRKKRQVQFFISDHYDFAENRGFCILQKSSVAIWRELWSNIDSRRNIIDLYELSFKATEENSRWFKIIKAIEEEGV